MIAFLMILSAFAGTEVDRLMYGGKVLEALQLAKQESKSAPTDVEAQERYIDLLFNVGRPELAVKIYVDRAKADPTNPDAHYLVGRAQPLPRDAQVSYERALKLKPTHARAHMGMGAIYTARGDVKASLAAYQRAVSYDTSLPEAWQGLIRAHLGEGNAEAALQAAQRAKAAVPDVADPYLTIAIIEPGMAVQVLTEGARMAGDDPRIHAALAETLLATGDGKGAAAAAARSLSINPSESVAARIRLFSADVVNKSLDPAGYTALLKARSANNPADFDPLVKAYPKAVTVYLSRAHARLQAGDAKGALQDLIMARTLAPDEPEVLGQLGIAYFEQGLFVDALNPLRRAAAERPWDSSLQVAYGRAASKAGRHEVAISTLSAVSQQHPSDTDITIALADALLLAKRQEDAYQVVFQASQRGLDQRLMIALMAAATQAGRFNEAAEIMERIAEGTHDAKAKEIAEKLREKARQSQQSQ